MKLDMKIQVILLSVISILVFSVTLIIYNNDDEKSIKSKNTYHQKNNTSTIEKLNINDAEIEDYIEIGFQPRTAQYIMDYRVINGRFNSIDDLLYVPGIGTTILNKMKEKIYCD